MPETEITRRQFLGAGAASAALLGAGLLAPQSALGANDKLRIGLIGVGDRMGPLMREVRDLSKDMNCQITGVCDIWTVNRDKAVKTVTDWYGAAPKVYKTHEEMYADKNIDAVIIATTDFSHATLLRQAIIAGKHTYCEKPTANTLADANAVLAAAESHPNIIVQVGTQRRSDGGHQAAAEFVKTGALGKITRVTASWNYFGARWLRGGGAGVNAADVDWKQFTLGRYNRPFDARIFREWRLFRPFSTGIPCQWLSHIVDAVHLVTGAAYPKSCVAQGGIFNWDDGRQNGDMVQALFEYPEGFILNYSTGFGNDAGGLLSVAGTNGTLYSGEFDAKGWRAAGDGGDKNTRLKEEVLVKGEKLSGHMKDWLDCVRTGKQPRATVRDGHRHSVALVMAVQAMDTGKKQFFDPDRRIITSV